MQQQHDRSPEDGQSLPRRRSSASLPTVAAGAESASKARQLRHAATFAIRFTDPDANEDSLAHLLRRHLQTQSEKSLDVGTDAKLRLTPATPQARVCERKLSAKVERALQFHDNCERALARFCESKRRSLPVPASPSRDVFDKPFYVESENVHEGHSSDKSAFDRLLRKLSPAMKNKATTHVDLVHSLQGCTECSLRVTFCARCAARASEFFDNFNVAELQAMYGRDLPPPDARLLEAFAAAVTKREYRATH